METLKLTYVFPTWMKNLKFVTCITVDDVSVMEIDLSPDDGNDKNE